MAKDNEKTGAVEYRVKPDGDHAIGAVIEGVFVPFTTLDGGYVAGLVQSGKEAATEEPATEAEGGEE